MAFAVRYAARTDVGLVRSRNEDSGYAGPHLLAVADGMGGHAGGNVASSLVIAQIAPLDGDSHGVDDAATILSDAIAEANTSLAQSVAKDDQLRGMGTTLTALMRAGATKLALVHIGDSRAYLFREGRLTQISRDHSFVQTLVDSGRISPEEAEGHPQRSLVTRVLTGSPEDEPDVSMREAKVGDRYLICSDGLSDYVAVGTIESVLTEGQNPEVTTRRLVDLALKAGAPDNVTCVMGDIVDARTSPPSQPIVVGAAAEKPTKAGTAASTPAAKAAALRRSASADDSEAERLVLAEEDDTDGPRRWLRPALLSLVALLAVIGACLAAYDWSQRQLFVAEASGRVAIFQGVNQSLGPIDLYSVRESSTVSTADLPDFYREAVTQSISVASIEDGREKVGELRAEAVACTAKRQLGIPCGSSDQPVSSAGTASSSPALIGPVRPTRGPATPPTTSADTPGSTTSLPAPAPNVPTNGGTP